MNLIRSAIADKYQFKIANAAGASKTAAILTGVIETLGTSVSQSGTTPFAVTAVDITYSDLTELTNAGLSADFVVDDGTPLASVTVTALDSNRKFRFFRQFLQKNTLVLKKLVIAANNSDVFDEAMTIGQISPLRKQDDLREILLSEFFDQFQNQDNKIIIDFEDEGGLVIDKNTFMSMPIPDSRTVTFQMIFM